MESYYEKNKERILKYNKEWWESNKDWFRRYGINYRKNNREKIRLKRNAIWRLKKQRAVDYLGGKCIKCGYNKCNNALEFHHYRGKKSFAISSGKKRRSWEVVKKELKKCMLLCSNCHKEISW